MWVKITENHAGKKWESLHRLDDGLESTEVAMEVEDLLSVEVWSGEASFTWGIADRPAASFIEERILHLRKRKEAIEEEMEKLEHERLEATKK